MIATSKWFVKKRLFACSISVMGASLGAVFYPLITQLILSRYSLFNTLFLLSSVQLNSIAASLLLFDNKSQILASSIAHNYRKHSKNNSKINGVRDSETQSQVSTSTNPNLTLKQYWRKFIQTRKTQSNTRKNLFHLIAEEKRKTRTLSKSSLEDGFVITTSNNLLAPNENVIVNRQVKLSAAPNTKQKLITRIANSLRSLTHSSHTSSPRINEPSPLMSVFEGPIHADPHDILHTDSDEDDEHNSYGFNANIPRINPKNPRYMNYRNSLTNSVRGSLMECSVPEEECNEEDVNSGCDGTCSMDEEDQCGKKIQRLSKRRSNFNRPRPVLAENEFNLNEALKNLPENNVGYSVPTLVNLRRFISTIETASFLNLPLNLEPIEYNLRNCLIKKSAEKYRKRKFNSFGIVHDMATMFIDYLIYTFNLRLFFNQMLLILNFSFLLSSTGFVIILFYIGDYSAKYHLAKLESTYILCLIGLSCGLGRIVSTISYKVNESNAKGRIFAYILTLFLSSGVLFISVFLCTTLFSFSMFAMAFGIFIGFNFNLRTLFLYDIIGLEWSDDSLFFYGTFVQALGVFFGIPLAGKWLRLKVLILITNY